MYSYTEVLQRKALLQDALSGAIEDMDESQLTTLSMVFEDDHFHVLLEAMKEVKQGKIVSFKSAFSDLN